MALHLTLDQGIRGSNPLRATYTTMSKDRHEEWLIIAFVVLVCFVIKMNIAAYNVHKTVVRMQREAIYEQELVRSRATFHQLDSNSPKSWNYWQPYHPPIHPDSIDSGHWAFGARMALQDF